MGNSKTTNRPASLYRATLPVKPLPGVTIKPDEDVAVVGGGAGVDAGAGATVVADGAPDTDLNTASCLWAQPVAKSTAINTDKANSVLM